MPQICRTQPFNWTALSTYLYIYAATLMRDLQITLCSIFLNLAIMISLPHRATRRRRSAAAVPAFVSNPRYTPIAENPAQAGKQERCARSGPTGLTAAVQPSALVGFVMSIDHRQSTTSPGARRSTPINVHTDMQL